MNSVLGDPNALGADPDELERLAASMNSRADLLDGHRVTLHATIHQAPWLGVLADAFRREWQTSHARVMAGAAEALRSTANLLLHRAAAQRKASAPDAQSSASVRIGVGGVPLQGSSGAGLQGGDVQLQGANLHLVTPGTFAAAAGAVAMAKLKTLIPNFPDFLSAEQTGLVNGKPVAGLGPPAQPGECVNWAIYRRAELGLPNPYDPNKSNNGVNLASHLQTVDAGHERVGGLVSYARPGHDPAGHVLVIEKINSTDPPSFTVSEMNVTGDVTNQQSDFRSDSELVQVAGGWQLMRGGVPVYTVPGSDVQFGY